MNRTSAVSLGAFLVALFAVITALFAVFRPPVDTPEARGEIARRADEVDTQTLLVHMVLFQRYAEKVDLARQAGNWPLATFYAHEINENAERLVEGSIVDEGTDVSAIAAEVMLPRAARLEAAARNADAAGFDSTYAAVLDGCNACHKRSGHRYVQIQRPATAGSYPSQSFAPIPGLKPQ